jgi:putative transposase
MKKRKSYPSDLTDAQWALAAPLIPAARPGGRPRTADVREVLNGVLYLDREGCTWRALPHDLPPWRTCYNYFRQWADEGTWDALLWALRRDARLKAGRKATPSACCVDSQSVKTAGGGAEVGTDGGKRVKGRKRHVATDTLGLLLAVVVTAANADDGTTAPRVLAELRAEEYPRLRAVFADSKYRNHSLNAYLAGRPRLRLEISSKEDGEAGFRPLKVRWVVEQSFGCMMRWRRLARDHERLPGCSEAMVKASAVHRLLRRLRPARLEHPFRYKRPQAKHVA